MLCEARIGHTVIVAWCSSEGSWCSSNGGVLLRRGVIRAWVCHVGVFLDGIGDTTERVCESSLSCGRRHGRLAGRGERRFPCAGFDSPLGSCGEDSSCYAVRAEPRPQATRGPAAGTAVCRARSMCAQHDSHGATARATAGTSGTASPSCVSGVGCSPAVVVSDGWCRRPLCSNPAVAQQTVRSGALSWNDASVLSMAFVLCRRRPSICAVRCFLPRRQRAPSTVAVALSGRFHSPCAHGLA